MEQQCMLQFLPNTHYAFEHIIQKKINIFQHVGTSRKKHSGWAKGMESGLVMTSQAKTCNPKLVEGYV
jgi:phosphoribosyl-AMP cyclohydrolase